MQCTKTGGSNDIEGQPFSCTFACMETHSCRQHSCAGNAGLALNAGFHSGVCLTALKKN